MASSYQSCYILCMLYISSWPDPWQDFQSEDIVHSALSYFGATTLILGSVLSFEFYSHNRMFVHSAVKHILCSVPLGHNFKSESRCLKTAVVVVVQYSLCLTMAIINQSFSLSLTLWLLLTFLFFLLYFSFLFFLFFFFFFPFFLSLSLFILLLLLLFFSQGKKLRAKIISKNIFQKRLLWHVELLLECFSIGRSLMFWNQIAVLFVCGGEIFCSIESITCRIMKIMNECVLNSKTLSHYIWEGAPSKWLSWLKVFLSQNCSR